MISAAIHGFILAFGLILPLGVQNVFVFNQGALQPKWPKALPVVITAALCDTLLISLAVLGISAVVLEISFLKIALSVIGIAFLLYMGYVTWKSKPSTEENNVQLFSARKQITFAASVSLLNPHAIMDTIGVIGTSSLTYTGIEKAIFTIVCIFVSWLWFFGLSIVGRLVGKLDHSGKFIITLNKISAVIMWGTAVYLLLSL
ncbi:LysE/ArgO family amino acid transporter [Neobacillus sp. 179-C4.2 HS]|jgi:L-lysine exporter family protein LysE/ArgO|uniref:LysE/ArgO family amino acid transporter n=1 Tax=Neobacillus driksii TaxID=3035913 RepID=A0ABV4YT75_9BACI|nr:LysE/ArgO family amino acid transporter [Neobacillus sp. 179.-C4.2 HS]MDP5193818.1 LysE/ArgO family amino acid transporter [Neobacillus sp. 179.-C4.2 HS]